MSTPGLKATVTLEPASSGAKLVDSATGRSLVLSATEAEVLKLWDGISDVTQLTQAARRAGLASLEEHQVSVLMGRLDKAGFLASVPPGASKAPKDAPPPELELVTDADVVPRLRDDLIISKAPESKGVLQVRDSTRGRSFTLYDFEVSIARMLDGKRTAAGVFEAAGKIGITVTLDSLNTFIKQMRAYRFIDEQPLAAGASTTWPKRAQWDPQVRQLFQGAIRLSRTGKAEEALTYLDALKEIDPANEDATELRKHVQEQLEGGAPFELDFDELHGDDVDPMAIGSPATSLLSPPPQAAPLASPPVKTPIASPPSGKGTLSRPLAVPAASPPWKPAGLGAAPSGAPATALLGLDAAATSPGVPAFPAPSALGPEALTNPAGGEPALSLLDLPPPPKAQAPSPVIPATTLLYGAPSTSSPPTPSTVASPPVPVSADVPLAEKPMPTDPKSDDVESTEAAQEFFRSGEFPVPADRGGPTEVLPAEAAPKKGKGGLIAALVLLLAIGGAAAALLRPVPYTAKGTAILEPNVLGTPKVPRAGTVKELAVQDGAEVKAGDTVATLDVDPLKRQIAMLEAQRDQAKKAAGAKPDAKQAKAAAKAKAAAAKAKKDVDALEAQMVIAKKKNPKKNAKLLASLDKQFKAKQAALEKAEGEADALTPKGGADTGQKLKELEAQLATAKAGLDQNAITAPVAGWFLKGTGAAGQEVALGADFGRVVAKTATVKSPGPFVEGPKGAEATVAVAGKPVKVRELGFPKAGGAFGLTGTVDLTASNQLAAQVPVEVQLGTRPFYQQLLGDK